MKKLNVTIVESSTPPEDKNVLWHHIIVPEDDQSEVHKINAVFEFSDVYNTWVPIYFGIEYIEALTEYSKEFLWAILIQTMYGSSSPQARYFNEVIERKH